MSRGEISTIHTVGLVTVPADLPILRLGMTGILGESQYVKLLIFYTAFYVRVEDGD